MGAVDSSTLTLGEGFDLAASQRLLEVCLDSTQEEAQMLERVQAALIQGADPNVALPYLSQGPMNGPEPRNPTMAACALGYPGVLACLLEAGAWAKGPAYDPPYDDSTTNEEGWHPLWLAMYQLGWAVVEKTPPQRLCFMLYDM